MPGRRILSRGMLPACLLFPTIVLAVDTDGDGVGDVVDVCCNTPAGVVVDLVGRPIGDWDGDCDVDVLDFAEFQTNLTGPMESGCCLDSDCNDGDSCTTDSCNSQTGECVFDSNPGCQECTVGPECPAELACDVPFQGSIDDPLETDTLCFCATEGELVRISVLELPGSSPSFNPTWRVLDSEGNATTSCGLSTTSAARVCGPLPAAGSPYHVEIEDGSSNDTGVYRVHLQRLAAARACDDLPLNCNEAITTTIESPVDTDLLSFRVENLEMVRINVAILPGSGPNFNPSWRLIDGAGNAPRSCGRTSFQWGQDCGPLPAAGNPYRLEVEDGARDDIGAVEVRLERTLAARACGAETIVCDEPIFEAIETRSDGHFYQFRAAEGELVRISVVKLPGGGLTFSPNWRIIDGFGNPFGTCGPFASTSRSSCGPLPAAGNPYAVQVQDGSLNDIGPFAIHLHRLSAARACDQDELTCGVPFASTINSVIDANLHAFTVPEHETVHISLSVLPVSVAHFDLEWRLIDGAGNPAPACGFFSTAATMDCPDLPASRNPYRIEVQDALRNGVGDYEVLVDFLTSGCP